MTFLFTDIEDSTQMLSRLGESYRGPLVDHRRMVRESVAAHAGREVDTAGDGFFCVFTSPSACLAAVAELQRNLTDHGWPEGGALRVRMGVHTGEASVDADAVVGFDVHKAARIAAAAHGGQVLVSAATAGLIADRLSGGLALRSLGPHLLKDLAGPEELFQLEAPGLAVEFPPIRTLDNPALRHNLPALTTSFVGRTAELAETAGLVGSARLVTLTGSGGCGKTRLGLQVAADLLDGSADGVWLCDFSPLSDPQRVASTVASALRLREDPSRPLLDQLVEHLRDRRLLLVLDNCEQVIDAAAKLADTLLRNCRQVHLLATSREPLGVDGEQVYRVPSLSLGSGPGSLLGCDAVQLFIARARAHLPGFTPDEATLPAVASICRHLDGIPLAIELAAARLRVLSPADIERRLADRFRLLTGGSRTVLPRHQTLRAAIDWSYEALNTRDRCIFDRLSVFAGGFGLEAAEAVCPVEQLGPYDVFDAVASLVDKSLVQAEAGEQANRYHLLETTRQYAAERLGEDPEAETSATQAHARFFLAFAESAWPHLDGPDQDQWASRLALDLDNLRAAGAHLFTAGYTEQALSYGVALSRFWWRSGLSGEGLGYLEAVLARRESGDYPALAVWACAQAAILCHDVGSVPAAERHVEHGLRLADICGDDAAVAHLLNQAAWNHNVQGRVEAALSTVEQALTAARRSGDEWRIAEIVMNRGMIRMSAGDPAEARAALTEAAERFARLGDHQGLVNGFNNLGYLELGQGNLDVARRHLEAGLASAPPPHSRVFLELNLATTLLREGDVVGAAAQLAEALTLSHQLADLTELAACVLDAAACLTASGEPEDSAKLHGAADSLREASGALWWPVEAELRSDDHARLHAALGEDAFHAAYAAGRHLDVDQTVQLAEDLLAKITAAV